MDRYFQVQEIQDMIIVRLLLATSSSWFWKTSITIMIQEEQLLICKVRTNKEEDSHFLRLNNTNSHIEKFQI